MTLCATVFMAIFAAALRAQEDHPLVARYTGSTIQEKDAEEFGEYKLITGADRTGRISR